MVYVINKINENERVEKKNEIGYSVTQYTSLVLLLFDLVFFSYKRIRYG